jgi:hypothetical protein
MIEYHELMDARRSSTIDPQTPPHCFAGHVVMAVNNADQYSVMFALHLNKVMAAEWPTHHWLQWYPAHEALST